MSRLPHLVAVTGPTASGKSALAVELARHFAGEVINADSVQVYRGADIGSAKPKPEELRGVPHRLLDILDPAEDFDAARFRTLARKAVLDANERGALPVVCGGTGLYLRALLGGLVETPPITEAAREELLRLRGAKANLYEALRERDPYTAESLEPADTARISRALLVSLSSGASLRRLREAHGHRDAEFSALVICLFPARDKLYSAIEARAEEMVRAGLVEETRRLRESTPAGAKLFGALGYRHAVEHLDGLVSIEEMMEKIKGDTRRFAKRQYTWWRHQPEALGWTRVEFPVTDDVMNVKPGNATNKLTQLVKNFIDRRDIFKDENVYFVPVAKK